jgi:hypothetical protein
MDMGLLPSWELFYRPNLGGTGYGVIQLYPFLQFNMLDAHLVCIPLCLSRDNIMSAGKSTW